MRLPTTPSLAMAALAMVALAATRAVAHMEMSDPAPLRSKFNTYSGSDIDYDMTSPLSASGSNYPCKGYHSMLGTEAATAVATWEAGNTYSATISGKTLHNGGSCQFSLSTDGGESFIVLKSYIGGCPSGDGARYDFTIPSRMGSHDDALFAWSWFNQLGNREMYMNCAVVNIAGGGSGQPLGRPTIFVANVGNGCSTADSLDVMFPSPGPDVDDTRSGAVAPLGSGCDWAPGVSGSSGPGAYSGTGAKNLTWWWKLWAATASAATALAAALW